MALSILNWGWVSIVARYAGREGGGPAPGGVSAHGHGGPESGTLTFRPLATQQSQFSCHTLSVTAIQNREKRWKGAGQAGYTKKSTVPSPPACLIMDLCIATSFTVII